jgi:hypothetical protein
MHDDIYANAAPDAPLEAPAEMNQGMDMMRLIQATKEI